MPELSLLGLFAHPDDEQLMSGTLAQAAADGVRTGLVCATRGEAGEIAEPLLATAENLGEVREREMRAAAAIIGVKYLWFLDYRDSGMAGTPDNDDPRCLNKCEEPEALAKLVGIIRQFRPTVMVTFDPTGGYGHPDHLAIHRLSLLAFEAAADGTRLPDAGEPWQSSRLYYSGFPRSLTRVFQRMIDEFELDTGFRGLDFEKLGLADEEITNVLNVREWLAIKERSLSAHRTQMNPNSPFAKMPAEMIEEFRGVEYFALAKGTPLPQGGPVGKSLFAGLS